MENNNPQGGEYSTNPQYDIKATLLTQYAVAYNALAEYVVEPSKSNTKKDAQLSIIKLMYPLFPKLYVLGKDWGTKRDYVAYFMNHPDKMELLELQAVFLILQRVMEKLGITKFERYKLPETKAYLEE